MLAAVLWRQNEFLSAETEFRQAIASLQTALQRDPNVFRIRVHHMETLRLAAVNLLADSYSARKRTRLDEASQLTDEFIAAGERLWKDFPERARLLDSLVAGPGILYDRLVESQEHERAAKYLQVALNWIRVESMQKPLPEQGLLREKLYERAMLLYLTQQIDESKLAFQECLALSSSIVDAAQQFDFQPNSDPPKGAEQALVWHAHISATCPFPDLVDFAQASKLLDVLQARNGPADERNDISFLIALLNLHRGKFANALRPTLRRHRFIYYYPEVDWLYMEAIAHCRLGNQATAEGLVYKAAVQPQHANLHAVLLRRECEALIGIDPKAPNDKFIESVQFELKVLQPETTLLRENELWRFDDRGQYPGVDWPQVDFDDRQWKSGKAPLGYSSNEQTQISYGPNLTDKLPSAFFRRTVNLPPTVPPSPLLRLDLRRDDAALVYLNGAEVVRDGLYLRRTWSSYADQQVTGPEETHFHTYILPHCDGVERTVVVAVELHQCDATSADLVMDMRLSAPWVVEITAWADSDARQAIAEKASSVLLDLPFPAGFGGSGEVLSTKESTYPIIQPWQLGQRIVVVNQSEGEDKRDGGATYVLTQDQVQQLIAGEKVTWLAVISSTTRPLTAEDLESLDPGLFRIDFHRQ